MRRRDRIRARGRAHRAPRRLPLRAVFAVVAALCALAAVAVPATGAYLTDRESTTGSTATAARLGAVALTATPGTTTAAPTRGQATALAWGAADLAAWPTGSRATYTVERSADGSFADATTVYRGPALRAEDQTGAAPASTEGWAPLSGNADLLAEGVARSGMKVARIGGRYVRWDSWTYPSPTEIVGFGAGVTELVTGSSFVCGMAPDAVYCAGDNGEGQLGDGTTTSRPLVAARVRDARGVLAGRTLIDIAAGERHVCVLASDGTIGCWGAAQYGELGPQSTTRVNSDVLRLGTGADGRDAFPAFTTARPTALAAATRSTCAVTAADVLCWGYNFHEQTAAGTTWSSWPIRVTQPDGGSLTGATAIDGGSNTYCVIRSGALTCWGDGGAGQFDDARANRAAKAIPLNNGSGWTDVSIGDRQVCAVRGAAVLCWGDDVMGLLGRGTVGRYDVLLRSAPILDRDGLLGGRAPAQLTAGAGDTCVVTAAAGVACWGGPVEGGTTPVAVPTALRAKQPACTAGAVPVAAGRCSLEPGRTYSYRIGWTVDGVTGWRSPTTTAARR